MPVRPVRPLVLSLAFVVAALSACSDTSTNLAAGTGQNMSLSFSGRAPVPVSGAMSVASAQTDTLVQASGSDTLRITSVGIVLRKIELERISVPVVCDSTPEASACEELRLGPQLVNVPLAPGAQTALAVVIDSGSYASVQFKIHKPGNDSLDLAFKAANPDFANVSIRVTGTFDGVPFTYTSTLDQEQEYEFVPPLVVDASGSSTNLTIRLDVSTWFRVGGTGAVIDPSTANPGGANEGAVKGNIKHSVKAFRDENHDGDEHNG